MQILKEVSGKFLVDSEVFLSRILRGICISMVPRLTY